jgi:ribonucleotide reductase alpha subunit
MDEKFDVNSSLSENAVKVLEKRYLKKDASGGTIETPEELFRRVAKDIATHTTVKKPQMYRRRKKNFLR